MARARERGTDLDEDDALHPLGHKSWPAGPAAAANHRRQMGNPLVRSVNVLPCFGDAASHLATRGGTGSRPVTSIAISLVAASKTKPAGADEAVDPPAPAPFDCLTRPGVSEPT
jgi:hypothetical protein